MSSFKQFKAWYFLYFSSMSCIGPYLNIIYRSYGLSERSIGTVALLRPFVGLPAGSVVSGIADKYRIHRIVLLIALLVATLTRCALYIAWDFYQIVIIVVVAGACSAPVTVLIDSCCTAACHGKEGYARQRMYGAIGWGTFSFISGWCMDKFGIPVSFLLHALLAAVTFLPSLAVDWAPLEDKLLDSHDSDAQGSPKIIRHNEFWRKFSTLVTNLDAMLFFGMTLIMGTAVGTIEGFLFLFLDDLGTYCFGCTTKQLCNRSINV